VWFRDHEEKDDFKILTGRDKTVDLCFQRSVVSLELPIELFERCCIRRILTFKVSILSLKEL
jgi:hypothetical protein